MLSPALSVREVSAEEAQGNLIFQRRWPLVKKTVETGQRDQSLQAPLPPPLSPAVPSWEAWASTILLGPHAVSVYTKSGLMHPTRTTVSVQTITGCREVWKACIRPPHSHPRALPPHSSEAELQNCGLSLLRAALQKTSILARNCQLWVSSCWPPSSP